MPTNRQVQDHIQSIGYDLRILGDLDKHVDQDGLECTIDGHQTYLEVYVDDLDGAVAEYGSDWIMSDITNQDTAISFVWGADAAAGACIGLISIAFVDLGDALIYYVDDQMRYTREMLLADTPQFLAELSKQGGRT